MDEQRMRELFRDAAGEPPPARFDLPDVLARSRRETTRRHGSARVLGIAAGIVLVVGAAGVGIGLLNQGGPIGTASSAGSAVSAPEQQNNDQAAPRAGAAPTGESGSGSAASAPGYAPGPNPAGPPVSIPTTPGEPPAGGGGVGAGRETCGAADSQIAAAITGALPAAAVASAPLPITHICPIGARGAAVQVRDGATAGRLEVVLGPATGLAHPGIGVPGESGSAGAATTREDGSVAVPARSPNGRSVAVLSVPATPGGPAPFATTLVQIADEIAATLS